MDLHTKFYQDLTIYYVKAKARRSLCYIFIMQLYVLQNIRFQYFHILITTSYKTRFVNFYTKQNEQ